MINETERPRYRLSGGHMTVRERNLANRRAKACLPETLIDDDARREIEACFAALPRFEGIANAIYFSDLYINLKGAYSRMQGKLYRATPDTWGLDLRVYDPSPEQLARQGNGRPTEKRCPFDAGESYWRTRFYRGTLKGILGELTTSWVYPTLEWSRRNAPALAKRKVDLVTWVQEEFAGDLLVKFPVFRTIGEYVRVVCVSNDDPAIVPAQKAAARALAFYGANIREALIMELADDYERYRRIRSSHQAQFFSLPDLPRLERPADVARLVELNAILILPRKRDGLAYTCFELTSPWRVNKPLRVVMHGDRAIGCVDYGEEDRAIDSDLENREMPPSRIVVRAAADRLVPPAWVLHDKPAVIPLSELPIWGDEGRLEVSMDLKKVGRDWVRTDAQLDAAALVAGLTAIRRALFLGLQLDHQRHADGAQVLGSFTAEKEAIAIRRLHVRREEQCGIAYVEVGFYVPWRSARALTVVVHAARVVATVERKASVGGAIRADRVVS